MSEGRACRGEFLAEPRNDDGKPYKSEIQKASLISRMASYTHVFEKPSTKGSISDHAVIGNLNTIALIDTHGTISWCCFPDFDSPSIFGSLLDHDIGGFYTVSVGAPVYTNREVESKSISNKQMYHPDTNMLISRHFSTTGVGQVLNYFPLRNWNSDKFKHSDTIVRELEVVRGRIYFSVECCPAFDYGRKSHTLEFCNEREVRFHCETGLSMSLNTTSDVRWSPHPDHVGGVQCYVALNCGERLVFFFQKCEKQEKITFFEMSDVELLRTNTIKYWRKWLGKCTYRGRWREHVHRSSLMLKLLTFKPTGAVVASPTTSLPSGTDLNVSDMRISLIRDSSYAMYAFVKLGFMNESTAFLQWIEERITESDLLLRIGYGIRGEIDQPVCELDHFQGIDGSPVMNGSDACHRESVSLNGFLLNTVYLCDTYGERISVSLWRKLVKLVDYTCLHWTEPDYGHWSNTQGAPKDHYTTSKVNAWLAVDRAIRIAEVRSFPADIHHWRCVRDLIKENVMENGYDHELGSFVEVYGSKRLDSSLLRLVLIRFVSPTDPRMISTIKTILSSPAKGGLANNWLVHRNSYTNADLMKMEGTPPACTYLAVAALAEMGRHDRKLLDQARLMFEQAQGFAGNHVDLLPEENSFSGKFQGNFPRGFSQLMYLSAMLHLNEALDSSVHRLTAVEMKFVASPYEHLTM